MSNTVVLVILLLVIILLGPIATIWALNALFPVLAIPYTLETWFATVIIGGIIRGDGLSFKGK